jgi:adenylosuccinate synthase
VKIAKVVVGSGWGDEGKGLLTEYFSRSNTVVVRANGGSQAGHTCVQADGRRHVFHHFGSGSFRGATTYLSRFFIANPILYLRELTDLRKLHIAPSVIADPRAYVTTPYDMIINQMIELQRGNDRHGSCGNGINETMKRSEFERFRLTVWDLSDITKLIAILQRIRNHWVPERLAVLGLTADAEWKDHLTSDGIFTHFLADAESFYRSMAMLSTSLQNHQDIVFEGAQGLLLDEDHKFFPYVTHSHTGLKNVNTLAIENNIDALRVTYVTRAYATRHGAGPFPREVAGLKYDDQTNVTNDWQGSLRFGHLDLDLLAETIQHDLTHATIPVQPVLAITCLDQVGAEVAVWQGGRLHHVATKELPQRVREWLQMPVRYISAGPTAEHVVRCPIITD